MALFNYECDEIKHIIEAVSPNYPQLTTYEKEWLYFNKYGYNAGFPVELEYETVSVNPYGSVSNAIPFRYKSAILKGKTDENLQSVKMPVLKTTGKNLFNNNNLIVDGYIISNGKLVYETGDNRNASDYIDVEPNCLYSISGIKNSGINGAKTHQYVGMYDKNQNIISATQIYCASDRATFTTTENTKYIRVSVRNDDINRLQIEKGAATTYEPHQSNILTVNEDITLRSNGDVYDELNLLTGRLTQRIGEDGEVLSQAVVKTVALTPLNKPYEGTNHYVLTSNIPCEAILEVPVVSTGEQTLQEING